MHKNYGENKLQISTKQIRGSSSLTEQIFAGDLHIGLMVRPLGNPVAPVRAYYIKGGTRIDLGTFSTKNFARRDAKKAIIERYEKEGER